MSEKRTEPISERPHDFEIHCRSEKSLLRMLRRFVAHVAEEVGFGAEDTYKIEMAVDEACTNVACHAYSHPSSPTLEERRLGLKLGIQAEGLIIQVEDRGRGMNVESLPGPGSLSEYQSPDRPDYGGLGILIMKEFMDEVTFMKQPESGTIVTLRKYLRTPPLDAGGILQPQPLKAGSKHIE